GFPPRGGPGHGRRQRRYRGGLLGRADRSTALPGQHPGHDRTPLVEWHRDGHADRTQGRELRLTRRRPHRCRPPRRRAAPSGSKAVVRGSTDEGLHVGIAHPARHAAAGPPEPGAHGRVQGTAPATALRSDALRHIPGAAGGGVSYGPQTLSRFLVFVFYHGEHRGHRGFVDRKSTRLNSSHVKISYAVFCFGLHVHLHSFPTRRSSDLVHLNRERMAGFREQLRPLRYDPTRYDTYLEQLGVEYPTVRKP